MGTHNEEDYIEELIEPLRVCRHCGKKAFTRSDLEQFKKSSKALYGRDLECKECLGKQNWFRKNKDKTEEDYKFHKKRKKLSEDTNIQFYCYKCLVNIKKNSSKNKELFREGIYKSNRKSVLCKICDSKRYFSSVDFKNYETVYEERNTLHFYKGLRKCSTCGLEAFEEKDLELFHYNTTYKYSRANKCIKCFNIEANYKRNNSEELLLKSRTVARKRVNLRRMHPQQYALDYREEKAKIDSIYKECVELSYKDGIEYHIDHCIPINSKLVCGFHISSNLQIVTKEYNLKKCNKFSKDFPEQGNVSDIAPYVTSKTADNKIFSLLGTKLTWEEFLEYEKKHYKDNLYE